MSKNAVKSKAATVLLIVYMSWAFMGCATSKQLMRVEDKADLALERANQAMIIAQENRAQLDKLNDVLLRAEKAAIRAEKAAEKTEAMANKGEKIFMKKMKK